MKGIKVKELIELLQKMNPKSEISLEGCDCEGGCVGISKNGKTVLLRRSDGCYRDELEIIEPE